MGLARSLVYTRIKGIYPLLHDWSRVCMARVEVWGRR